jgi:hypothetical protein
MSESGKKLHKVKSKTATKLWTHISGRSWKRAMFRLSRTPEEAAVWTMIEDETCPEGDSCYRLPLHRACALNPPRYVVEELLKAHPNAVSSPEKYSMLPLHISAAFHANEEVIECLLTKHPEAVQKKDAWNRLPLHIACASGSSLAVINRLLEAFPASLEHRDNWGRTPLNCASQSQCPNKKLIVTALMVQKVVLPPTISTIHTVARIRLDGTRRPQTRLERFLEQEQTTSAYEPINRAECREDISMSV